MAELKFRAGDHVMVPMVVEKVLDDERLYRVHFRDHVKASGFVPESALDSATPIDAATAPLVAERERLIARVESVETWNAGTVTPRLDVGWEREFIVAVKRAHSGKVYSFAASYLNAYPLRYEYCPKGEGRPCDGCENGCLTTGWFCLTGDDGDGCLYQQLELNKGDELLGWRDVPQWSALAEKEPG